ncbi:MAG: TPM domain-containing protein [Flavobacteriales bacterium]
MNIRNAFSDDDVASIERAIQSAEQKTSAEIRVHIENTVHIDALDRAAFIFDKLGMQRTDARNGVLIYVAISSRKFAIIGDIGIHQFVQDSFWEQCSIVMADQFKIGHYAKGLELAIQRVSEVLALHHPRKEDDMNELSDTISFG